MPCLIAGTNCGNQISAAGVTVNLPCKDSGSINLPNVDLPNVNLPNVNLPNVNLNLPSLGLSIGRKMLQVSPKSYSFLSIAHSLCAAHIHLPEHSILPDFAIDTLAYFKVLL